VGIVSAEACFAALPEATDPVRVPVAVADPFATIVGASGEIIRSEWVLSGRDPAFNFISKRGRDFFVGIQAENPGLSGLLNYRVFLADVSFPGLSIDPSTERLHDAIRSITDVLVQDNHDFRAPGGHAGKHTANPFGFSARYHAHADGQR